MGVTYKYLDQKCIQYPIGASWPQSFTQFVFCISMYIGTVFRLRFEQRTVYTVHKWSRHWRWNIDAINCLPMWVHRKSDPLKVKVSEIVGCTDEVDITDENWCRVCQKLRQTNWSSHRARLAPIDYVPDTVPFPRGYIDWWYFIKDSYSGGTVTVSGDATNSWGRKY